MKHDQIPLRALELAINAFDDDRLRVVVFISPEAQCLSLTRAEVFEEFALRATAGRRAFPETK